MKQFKKFLVMLMCVCAVAGVTACGSSKDTTSDTNSATDGTKNEGVVDEMGDDVKDGVDNMKDDMKDGMDDTKDNMNDTTDPNSTTTDPNTTDKATESGKQ